MTTGQVSPRIKIDTTFKFKDNPINIFPNEPIIGETEKGKIVRLKRDNMPCLLPDLTGQVKIPNAYDRLSPIILRQIPNIYPRKERDTKQKVLLTYNLLYKFLIPNPYLKKVYSIDEVFVIEVEGQNILTSAFNKLIVNQSSGGI